MKLADYLDVDLLAEHVKNRVVNAQHHRYAPLTIYNYGQKAMFESIWDDVTCKCRGLIVNTATQEVVARPFPKFFNLGTAYRPETAVENLPPGLPEVTSKTDGSLGVYFRVGETPAIATRGSFISDQAAWASTWYYKNLSKAIWPSGWTPLFEIVYPDNRIVVKYDWEGLELLTLINIETGEELCRPELENLASLNGCRLVEKFDKKLEDVRFNTIDKEAENAEGYVLTWHLGPKPPLKLKIKFLEYQRLHRLLTSISPKAIWELLRDGQSFSELLDNTPSHYQEWVNYWKNGLQAEYGRIEQKAKAIYESCTLPKDGEDKEARKALAEFFTLGDRKSVSAVLFRMLDKRPYDDVIWGMIKEKTKDQDPFRREE
jgi:hypothetical protein